MSCGKIKKNAEAGHKGASEGRLGPAPHRKRADSASDDETPFAVQDTISRSSKLINWCKRLKHGQETCTHNMALMSSTS